jgi:hypothetical protein
MGILYLSDRARVKDVCTTANPANPASLSFAPARETGEF